MPDAVSALSLELALIAGNYCRHCHRPFATEGDWDKYEGGDGDHLCWEEGDCGWVATDGLTWDDFIATHLVRVGYARA